MDGERPEPAPIYQRNLELRRETCAAAKVIDDRLSMIRGIVFLIALIGCFFFAWASAGLGIWVSAWAIGFAGLVMIHGGVVREFDRATAAVKHYEDGIDRLDDNENRWIGNGPTGERFSDPKHPYAGDLDLFGRASMFQRLSLARTPLGEETLARWLMEPPKREAVLHRQQQVQALAECVLLREELALLPGKPVEETDRLLNREYLLSWGVTPPDPLPKWHRVVAYGLSAGLLVTLFGWLGMGWPRVLFVIVLMGLIIFLFAHRDRIKQALLQSERAGEGLHALANVLRLIETGTDDEGNTPAPLAELREHLGSDPPASKAIAKLDAMTEALRNGLQNQFYAAISLALCRPIHLADQLEHWREEFGPHIGEWFDAAGQFEALLSLSGYAFERHRDPFPEILEDSAKFSGTSLGHPLLPNERCVRNDVEFGNPERLLLVSGSNMSGKSTLLRTVGLNAVLAFAGAPVRAESLRLSPLQVGSAMRVQDSLAEGESFFFAVIRRMKAVIDLTTNDLPLLFLLDEILQGTNSHDRRVGAEGIIQTLLEKDTIGFVTTHDLALTQIADSIGERATNVHFEDRIEAAEMIFDYQLRPGVVTRSNALELMRLVGLDVPSRDD